MTNKKILTLVSFLLLVSFLFAGCWLFPEEKTITITWSEDAVRYDPNGTIIGGPWTGDLHDPATLILTDGEYHFADVYDFYNIHMTPEMGLEGSVVIDETGQLSADTTYTGSKGLPIKEHIEGEVEIIIYEDGENGTMKGTYTQWGYAFGSGDVVLDEGNYPNAIPAQGQGPGWWFIGCTEYTAYEE